MRRRSGLEARKVGLDTERNALQAFLSDELRIIENASRVRTYLQSEDRSVVMSMIESFVKKVELKNGSVTIHYSIPMPPGGNGKKVGSETLPLNGDQWPMETPAGGKEGPEKAWRPCFSRLRASSVDILLWVRPLLLEIPFPEALPPDSVRRARKLGHIRKLPQMPAPAEVPEAVNRNHPFNGGQVLVLHQPDASPQSELTEDLLAVLHTFSCRLHGLRRYRAAIEADSGLSQPGPEEGDS